MEDKHEHHHWLIVILAICVLALTGIVGFFAYQLFYGNAVINVTRVEYSDEALDETLDNQRMQLEDYLETQEVTPAE